MCSRSISSSVRMPRSRGAGPDVGSHPLEIQVRALAENHGSLDDVLKLSHVAGPRIGPQRLQRRRARRSGSASLAACAYRCVKYRTKSGMSSVRSRSGWQGNRKGAQPVIEIGTEPPRLDGLLQIPVAGGNHPDIHGIVWGPPTRSNSPSWRTRRSFGCSSRGRSPISSRKSVPPWASSNRPCRRVSAPVKAPFSCPNSSLSIRPAGRAAQLTLTSA